jgi:hypothetical protein
MDGWVGTKNRPKIIEKIDELARDWFAFVAGFCIDFNSGTFIA